MKKRQCRSVQSIIGATQKRQSLPMPESVGGITVPSGNAAAPDDERRFGRRQRQRPPRVLRYPVAAGARKTRSSIVGGGSLALQWPILIGVIAGLLAKLLTSGFGPGGLLLRVVVGIAGALFTTYLGDTVGMYRPGESGGILGAMLGAIVMLIIYQLLLATMRR
jgi:uncharacterized membrane protein YeaQ/YmgE (transglycosylase-associated protein family)